MFEERHVEVVGSDLAGQMAHRDRCAPGKENSKSKRWECAEGELEIRECWCGRRLLGLRHT